MIIISHRGNINGSVPEKENRPSYIDSAIQLNYEVEVDLRFINGEFWLGHDTPQYKIEIPWMIKRKSQLWFHCKDKNSAIELINLNKGFKFFCHTNDDFVLTSINKIWVHDLSKNIDGNCIIPLLSIQDLNDYTKLNPYAICTDYPIKMK